MDIQTTYNLQWFYNPYLNILYFIVFVFYIFLIGMKSQKSRAYMHQVIMELRQNSQKLQANSKQRNQSKNKIKNSKSNTATKQNSQTLSQSQNESQFLVEGKMIHSKQLGDFNIINSVSSQYLNNQKEQSEIKRQIKTARPISRRKITSKDKYSKTVKPKQQIFKIGIKKSEIFEPLQILDAEQFIEEKDTYKTKQINNDMSQQINIKAFWTLQHIFVSLFPIQYSELIVYNHPNVLPVYGEVKLNNKRYVVSNQYKNATLKDLIQQFGPFQQKLCKQYLFQIVCGVEQMHNKKMAHNRLNSQNILYNKEGQIFINVVKSTTKALSQKQKQAKLFQYCPQILLSKTKSNSLKSDIWGIGIILLDMLFNFGTFNVKNLKFHPYNWTQQNLQKNDSIMVDNLKQLYQKSFQANTQNQSDVKITSKYNNLTPQCKDLIQKCLIFKNDQRPNIKQIKQHKFFTKTK